MTNLWGPLFSGVPVLGWGEASGFEAADEVGEASAQGTIDGGAHFAQFAFPSSGADGSGGAGFQTEWGLGLRWEWLR